jgi:outer membrane protein OmpA-like peptidoglycan-associated protein
LRPPAPAPEVFGDRDDFPWLPRLPGSALIDAETGEEGLDATTADDAEPRIVGNARLARHYEAPAGAGAEAIVQAYAAALRQAGWAVTAQPERAAGGALVVAHYAAGGRDVWARIAAAGGRYEIAAADVGAGIAQAFATGCHLVLNGITFGLADATLQPESESTLAALARLLKAERALRVEVVAYTDPRDAEGDHDTNLRLSAQRAEAVKTWLRQHRIDGERIATRGAGDGAPLRPSDTDAHRARNRRIELRRTDCR